MAKEIREILSRQQALAEGFGDTKKAEFAEALTTIVDVAEQSGALYSTVPAEGDSAADNRLLPSFYIPELRAVHFAGELIPLSRLENRLMGYFANNAHRVVTHDELRENVWGGSKSVTVVEKGINRLRAKIEPNPGMPPSRIISIRGEGYMFFDPSTPYGQELIQTEQRAFDSVTGTSIPTSPTPQTPEL